MKRLQDGIRTKLASIDDIVANKVAQLPFLNACVQESLRLVPPLAANSWVDARLAP
jgi:cytochrome P450